jgi:hypothetical protein
LQHLGSFYFSSTITKIVVSFFVKNILLQTKGHHMPFTKTLLFSFIFIISSCPIIAMEQVTRSIQQKLSTLDTKIVAMTKQLKLAEEQKNKDKIVYDTYCTQLDDRRKQASWFAKVTNQNKYTFDWDKPEVHNYKGDFLQLNNPLTKHAKPIYKNNGSKGEYQTILAALSQNQTAYSQFKDNLERGKRIQDLEFLILVEQDLQNHLNQLTTTK